MKNIIKFFFFSLFLLNSSVSYSEVSIRFIDMNKLISTSKAGASITAELEIINKSNVEKFQKIEKNLKEQEDKILTQKNILDKIEYDKKVKKLRLDINNYRKDRQNAIDQISKIRIKATNDFLNILNSLIVDYSKENSISIILQKEYILMGKKDLDITNKILKLVDSKVTKIKIN
jgi:outer membrane protein